MNEPELLLPVGTRDMLESAINNGADAVYYGVPHWNARGRTEDFSFEDVEEMIRYARLRGRKDVPCDEHPHLRARNSGIARIFGTLDSVKAGCVHHPGHRACKAHQGH